MSALLKFSYRVYSFNLPDKSITEEKYIELKNTLLRNHETIFVNESVYDQFHSIINNIFLCIISILFLGFIDVIIRQLFKTSPEYLESLMGGYLIVMLYLIVSFLVEYNSFVQYLKDKRWYFDLIKFSIINTTNYIDFCKYSEVSNMEHRDDFNLWLESENKKYDSKFPSKSDVLLFIKDDFYTGYMVVSIIVIIVVSVIFFFNIK